MPTTVHLPKHLLRAVDHRARELGISRNRLIILALEHELAARTWSAEFLNRPPLDDATSGLLDDSLRAVKAHRKSKRPPKL